MPQTRERIQVWLLGHLADSLGIDAQAIDLHAPFDDSCTCEPNTRRGAAPTRLHPLDGSPRSLPAGTTIGRLIGRIKKKLPRSTLYNERHKQRSE